MKLALRTMFVTTGLLMASLPQQGAAREQVAGAARELAPVALREPVGNAPPEQWEDRPVEGKGVRNVVNPTLTPFLPATDKSNGLALIVAPGGGFVNLAFDNEGVRVARHLAENGIAAFVLKYRLRPTPRDEKEYRSSLAKLMSGGSDRKPGGDRPEISTPHEAVDDALAAVRLVRSNATKWGIDPAKIGMIGFSAGAMTTLGAGLSDDAASRPDFIAPIYGPRDPGPVSRDAPPLFLAIALDDPLFRFDQTQAVIDGWRSAGRPYEVHLYEKGGHGFGMRPRSAATELWMDQFLAWMKDRGLYMPAADRKAYELAGMKLGPMLDDPAMRAVLQTHLPMLVSGEGSQMARGLSLKEISSFAPQVLGPDKLKAVMNDLAALP
ncbi:MAG: alpha/beta hydrolase [Novosphingobium sp.]|nr:alpha/beta hydrolase [Novosphingobium sp.]